MVSNPLMDSIPLWGWAPLTIGLLILFYEGGFQFGKNRRLQHKNHSSSAPLLIGALFGTTGLVLALALAMTQAHFEEGRRLVIEEVQSIETAYLRTDYLSEPSRSTLRRLLRDYVNVRVQGTRQLPGENLSNLTQRVGEAIIKSEHLQEELWKEAVILARAESRSTMEALFIQSLNQVVSLHSARLETSVRARLPGTIWLSIYFLSFLSMIAVGYYSGWKGARSNVLNAATTLALAWVILLAMSLDRPWEGLFRISQQPLVYLLERMDAT